MGSPSDLSLNCKTNNYSTIPKSAESDQPDRLQSLEEFLARLEEERLKIDAFKRELPLCMQLLTNAMEAYRQQIEIYHANQESRLVLEEFMPLKQGGAVNDGLSEKLVNATSEKASWMTSAQLWSQANDEAKQPAQASSTPKDGQLTVGSSPPKLDLGIKQRNGGAFIPFSKDMNKVQQSSRSRLLLPDLALSSTEKDNEESRCSKVETRDLVPAGRESCGRGGGGGASAAEQGKGGSNMVEGQAVAQAHRKARRCWSPDLHRRFVNALQMLGGSQVATPKQIRELMKVDGLTNDEVKSHLQKYRLHTRRPIQAPQSGASAPSPQLVLLGGIWVPLEYAAAAAGRPSIYGAHAGTAAHYCGASMPHDFYPAAPYHHSLHRSTATAGYKGMRDSPDSDFREAAERSESIEDGDEREEREGGNSESSSWKGGEEKATVPITEDSNGSDVTLKV